MSIRGIFQLAAALASKKLSQNAATPQKSGEQTPEFEESAKMPVGNSLGGWICAAGAEKCKKQEQ